MHHISNLKSIFLFLVLGKTENESPLKIVSLSFDFDNVEMLALLKDRAEYLKDGKNDRAEAIQDKITDKKNKDLEKLMRPTRAFIIF